MCVCVCVRVQVGENMHRMCVTETMCVSFCVWRWGRVLLRRCKAMPHRDGLQGQSEGGRERPGGIDHGSLLCPHIAQFNTALPSAIGGVADR